jgi:acyl dehydratase
MGFEDTKLYFEDVQIGQECPTFVRQVDLMHWNRYAAVNDEFVQIHMDEEAGKKAGMKGVFGMGNLRYGYLHNMLREWAGMACVIRKVEVQHRAINYNNDTLTCKGKVSKKYQADGENRVDLDVLVLNQDGASLSIGTATIALPSRAKK